MNEYEKLKRLLYKQGIDYEERKHFMGEEIRLTTAPISIIWWDNELTINGCGYCNVWSYSAEYIARMLDRKFRDGEL